MRFRLSRKRVWLEIGYAEDFDEYLRLKEKSA